MTSMTHILPEPKNWEELDQKDSRYAWLSLQPYLERHGIALFGTPLYDLTPGPPACPPKQSFHPMDTEDFVHRAREHEKLTHFAHLVNYFFEFSFVIIDSRDRYR